MEERGPAAYVAEFLGTFLLVFFVCVVVTVNSADGLGYTDFAVIGLVHVFLLAMLIYTLGGASGAHFNPAVTLALVVLRKISGADALIYWLVQLSEPWPVPWSPRCCSSTRGRASTTAPSRCPSSCCRGGPLGGLLAEMIGTFVLMWAIMGTAVNPRGERAWAGMVIGDGAGLGA